MATLYAEYGIPIFCADQGEAPQKGAFYATTKGSNLSKIARAVYGDSSAWKILNMNAWNRDNVVYRADSADCASAKRESSWALNTVSPNTSAKSAYISLCQRDTKMIATVPARLFTYPVIWIPDPEKMPNPNKPAVEDPETEPTGPSVFIKPGDIVITPKPAIDDGRKPIGGDKKSRTPEGLPGPNTPSSPPKTAGIGLVLGGLAMLAALIFWPKKGKKGRK
jgi:hypothetical protein